MITSALILGIIGTITGCLALLIQFLAYRDGAKRRLQEDAREERESEPFFHWRGGSANLAAAVNHLNVTREFTNEGGAVTDLKIAIVGVGSVSITPQAHVGAQGSGKIEFAIPGVTAQPELRFQISYVTGLNKRSSQDFEWPQNAAQKRVMTTATK